MATSRLTPAHQEVIRSIARDVRRPADTIAPAKAPDRDPKPRTGVTAMISGSDRAARDDAASAIAKELGAPLQRVDLGQVMSKYIGETEKNLSRVFDAAERSGAVLLFDEADAVFGKRSEVKDSHDRYANLEVSYLLDRIEAYQGVAILSTNLKSNVDAPFMRRIRYLVDLPNG